MGSLFGLFDPRSTARATLYRRIGASVVRGRCRSLRPVPPLSCSGGVRADVPAKLRRPCLPAS
ncbi:mmpL family membrane domain protein [Mycobacterium xenopi 4042]|uniref:MmpL family membrane domain protein n=1 Tax=Mycobacterium xenopi 4042 TaxID=1299334 RepID=X7ZPT1_MYCXE|nr:mmpL family membrane domain protein [Mycobacterium xenopi 4042]